MAQQRQLTKRERKEWRKQAYEKPIRDRRKKYTSASAYKNKGRAHCDESGGGE